MSVREHAGRSASGVGFRSAARREAFVMASWACEAMMDGGAWVAVGVCVSWIRHYRGFAGVMSATRGVRKDYALVGWKVETEGRCEAWEQAASELS